MLVTPAHRLSGETSSVGEVVEPVLVVFLMIRHVFDSAGVRVPFCVHAKLVGTLVHSNDCHHTLGRGTCLSRIS